MIVFFPILIISQKKKLLGFSLIISEVARTYGVNQFRKCFELIKFDFFKQSIPNFFNYFLNNFKAPEKQFQYTRIIKNITSRAFPPLLTRDFLAHTQIAPTGLSFILSTATKQSPQNINFY